MTLIFIARAAVGASSVVRQRMLAQPSWRLHVDGVLQGQHHVAHGDRECPSDPPSPVITVTIGVRRRVMRPMLRAIASIALLGLGPGWASTSTKVTTGSPLRSASSMTRIALR